MNGELPVRSDFERGGDVAIGTAQDQERSGALIRRRIIPGTEDEDLVPGAGEGNAGGPGVVNDEAQRRPPRGIEQVHPDHVTAIQAGSDDAHAHSSPPFSIDGFEALGSHDALHLQLALSTAHGTLSGRHEGRAAREQRARELAGIGNDDGTPTATD